MSDSVIAALISLGGVIISTVVSCIAASALTNWRLAQLEKKVDEHNKWGEKFSEQTTEIALLTQKVENIDSTLKELKDYIKNAQR